ncbi:MAG TPA: rhodanese-like domain-containing protein [Candidatus Dormibacteraeota bacterium]|nr:rhodanese-like domain-containing protein [Candidatus Dormibacteraeota bacterium]
MTKWIVVACIMFGMAMSAPMVSAQDQSSMDQGPMDPTMMEAPPPTFIKPAEVLKMMKDKDKSFLLVDTQPAMAYAQSHVPGAFNYPFQERLTPPIPLPRDKTLILYCPCTHDEDSISMAKKLAEFGYYNVKILEGGWYKWEALKYPVAGTQPNPDATDASNTQPAAATETAANSGPLTSGRPVGAVTPSFRVIDVTGKYKGQQTCYVCEYGEAPTILAFFNKPSDQNAALIVKLNKLVAENTQKNLKGVVVMVDGQGSKEWLEKLAAEKGIKIPMVYLLQGPHDLGVRLYHINTTADNTFLVNYKRTVQTNLVNVSDNNFNEVAQATTKMLGGE